MHCTADMPTMFRVRFLCTRLTRAGEFGIDHRVAFMEGKVCVIEKDMMEVFKQEGVIKAIAPIAPFEPIQQSEIQWMQSIGVQQ